MTALTLSGEGWTPFALSDRAAEEVALLKPQVEVVLAEALEDFAEVVKVFVERATNDHDVVEVRDRCVAREAGEEQVDRALEDRRS